MRDVVILGSTGSVGTQALDVIRTRRDQFRVVGLGAGGANPELLLAQIREFEPARVAIGDPDAASAFERRLVVAETMTQDEVRHLTD